MGIPTRTHGTLDSFNQPAIVDMKALMLRHVSVSSSINIKLKNKLSPTWFC
ncbi:hypothetical protein BH11VER1_BH11VER1_15090 [soil metagenome]